MWAAHHTTGVLRRAADNFLPYDGLPSPSQSTTDKDVRRTAGKLLSAARLSTDIARGGTSRPPASITEDDCHATSAIARTDRVDVFGVATGSVLRPGPAHTKS